MYKNIFDNIKDIPLSSEWTLVKKITKGWSTDTKYYIEDIHGRKLLLRVSSIEDYDIKNKEFQTMKKVYDLGINMSEPIDFGVCNSSQNVYSLLSWIEGIAADEAITSLGNAAQYNLGIKAGKILKLFHSILVPADQPAWEDRMTKKIDKHIKKYKDSGIRLENDEAALKYIENNLHLLKDRPQNFLHGDYHVGNLIITNNNQLGVIDFNRWDYGDPFYDFYKMMIFSRELSISFAEGQIRGYFGENIPDNFFETLALYLADTILYSIVWAIPFGEKDVEGMIKRAKMILSDYDDFRVVKPKWFTGL